MTALLPHATKPCAECPWRRDTQPGQFPVEHYERLRSTSGSPGDEAPMDAPMFACHKSGEGKEIACAGWLAAEGYNHLGIRYAVIRQALPAQALEAGAAWPQLFGSYAEMARAQGGDRDPGAQ